MNYMQQIKEAAMIPLYSPRTTYSRYQHQIDKLTINLAINMDKYILGLFKESFHLKGNKLTLNEFIEFGQKNLNTWQKQLAYRQTKLLKCLITLFEEIDYNKKNLITWDQFNSMLIQKGLNLKSLRSQDHDNNPIFRPIFLHNYISKHQNPIQKIVMISTTNKLAYYHEQSNIIHFMNIQPDYQQLEKKNISNELLQIKKQTYKPVILNHQQLIVQTIIQLRMKNGKKEINKKEIVVSNYKNILLDIIYINDSKYHLLFTSSSDNFVRGWDVVTNLPFLARQLDNDDEKMEHHFPSEIHCMAWDTLNQVLYCSGKQPIIYQWVIKTDSERQLSDSNGHSEMVSVMMMLPKLQFLATGGYDGKMVLWDTIAQCRKFKYEGHTRAISDIAFHEEMILLFTSGYDHFICVWNPYIPSLIHKIVNSTQVLKICLIPKTNLLLSLDSAANIRIRDIKKFDLISSITIGRKGSEPTSMTMAVSPLRYFFAGNKITGYTYVHTDETISSDHTPLCIKYLPDRFSLYCPFRNSILCWNLLTGNLINNFRNQAPNDICIIDIIVALKLCIIGDISGNILLRKINNGLLIKKLYTHKTSSSFIINSSGSSLADNIIFTATKEGQIILFGRDETGEFNHFRTIKVRKIVPHANVLGLHFESKKNIVTILTSDKILFMEIDKLNLLQTIPNSMLNHTIIESIHQPILYFFRNDGNISGSYIPPHPKKFMQTGTISLEQKVKINSVVLSQTRNKCYIGSDFNLICFNLSDRMIMQNIIKQKQISKQNNFVWKLKTMPVKDIILLETDNILIVLLSGWSIQFINCLNGSFICQIAAKINEYSFQPIFFIKPETNQLYLSQSDSFINCDAVQHENIEKVHNPYFYVDKIQKKGLKISIVSNKMWQLFLNIRNFSKDNVNRLIKQRLDVNKQIEIQKISLYRSSSQESRKINKSIQLYKKWDKQKNQANSDAPLTIINNQTKITNRKQNKYTQFQKSNSKNTINLLMQKLGNALQSIDETDERAKKFIELASNTVKEEKNLILPKIGQRKYQ